MSQLLSENLVRVVCPPQTTALAKNLLLHGLFLSCNSLQDRSTFSCEGSSTGCRKTAMVSPQATGKYLLWYLESLIIFLFADFCVSRAFSPAFFSQLCTAFFLSFLICLPQGSATVANGLSFGQQQVCFGTKLAGLLLMLIP